MKLNIASFELNNFGYIIAVANIYDKHDRSTPSHYHWKILKCRMIIFSTSSILACPDIEGFQRLRIVFNQSGDDYDKLISLFMKFSLVQDGEIRTTTPEIFQMCFRYTMNARIAPLWNTLGEHYLINNRNFLTTKGPQEGVSYTIIFNDDNILTLEIKAVKINLMNSEALFTPGEWIRVLPSLNKAMIEDHHETLPQVSKFRCYKDLRRHWKNIHGYRLPEDEDSYYSVQFWRGEPLVYPMICIMRNFPIITPAPPSLEKIIIKNFLHSLNLKMSGLINTDLTLQSMEEGNDTELDTNKQCPPDSQAVSLCTPTQVTKHFVGTVMNSNEKK